MEDYLNFVGDSYFNSSVVFIVMGVIILIIGFFGCCGACTENSCMMTTFAFLLALVVITQVCIVHEGKSFSFISNLNMRIFCRSVWPSQCTCSRARWARW